MVPSALSACGRHSHSAMLSRLPAPACRVSRYRRDPTERSGRVRSAAHPRYTRTLHCQQIDQIQWRAVELLEHLMAATPFGKKPLANLPKDFDPIPRTDVSTPQSLRCQSPAKPPPVSCSGGDHPARDLSVG